MGWSVFNVRLRNAEVSPGLQKLIDDLLADGYEPYATSGVGNSLVMSFRRFTEGEASTFKDLQPGEAGYL